MEFGRWVQLLYCNLVGRKLGESIPLALLTSNPLRGPPTGGAQQEAGGQACSFDAVLGGQSLRTQSGVGKGATWVGVVVQMETTQHIVFGQFSKTKQMTSVKQ